jgi:DNA invertase Pin-like site-specific DNA recombinase
MSKSNPAVSSIAYSYLRFSHPDQAKGDSLRRQTELRDAWLQQNGVTLDTTLTLEDKGVSGFTGEHRDNPDRHALAAFVQLVKTGRIVRGSYLIVESLDRLSREDIIPALSLLLDLIQSGIRVVQLLPVETTYDAQANPMNIMMAIMELSRGHSESAMKSERIGRAWRNKKKRAAERLEPLSARSPAWLKLVKGKWQVIKKSAATIQKIFRLAAAGYGLSVIVRKLNAEKVPVVGRSEHWSRGSMAKLLVNRSVIGEYQPHIGRGRKRKPDGDAIPGYFPAIVTLDVWNASRASAESRRTMGKMVAKVGVNLFTGFIRDELDRSTVQIVRKGAKSSGPSLVSYNAIQGVQGAHYTSFPLATFEKAVLSQLAEIDPHDILNGDQGPDESLALAGELADVETRIAQLSAELLKGDVPSIAAVLRQLEDKKADLASQLADARLKAAHPLSETWGEAKSLLATLDAAPDPQDSRLRLRAAMRRMIKAIWLLVISQGRDRLAFVQITFSDHGRHRYYEIWHHPHTGNKNSRKPGFWCVKSFKADEFEALTQMEINLADKECVPYMLAQLPTTTEELEATFTRPRWLGEPADVDRRYPRHPLP